MLLIDGVVYTPLQPLAEWLRLAVAQTGSQYALTDAALHETLTLQLYRQVFITTADFTGDGEEEIAYVTSRLKNKPIDPNVVPDPVTEERIGLIRQAKEIFSDTFDSSDFFITGAKVKTDPVTKPSHSSLLSTILPMVIRTMK